MTWFETLMGFRETSPDIVRSGILIDGVHMRSVRDGPVDKLSTPGAKVFASLYALFCGLIFVGAVGLVLSPILHRLLHKFHIDDVDLQSEQLPSETDGSAAK